MANSFWQREKRMKRYNTLLFSVKEQSLETRKIRKLLAKEEEEEVQEDVQSDSKVVKEYMKKLLKCKSRSGQNLSLVIDYQNHVIDYTKHFMKRCDSSQLN